MMSKHWRYLLDTNVLSESRRPNADERVRAFFEQVNVQRLYVSALSFGELVKGAEQLRRKDPERSEELLIWIDDTAASFGERVLPVDGDIARIWGEIASDRSRPVIDTYLAATAIAYGLVLVTRNLVDFHGLKLTTFNPWVRSLDEI